MGGDRVCLGQIGAPHGVGGEVRLRPFTSDPQAIATYGPLETEDGRILEIESLRSAKNHFVATLCGIRDRAAAERLVNAKLYVPRERLPELKAVDEYYHADLIGLSVIDGACKQVGTVVAIHNFGAGDLLEVQLGTEGQTELIPFNESHVPTVDLRKRRIIVNRPVPHSEMPAPLRGRPTAKRPGGG